MNGEQFNFGQEFGELKGDVKTLHTKIDSLSENMGKFTEGIGKRVNDTESGVTKLETQMGMIGKVSGWILAPAISVIVGAILYLVLKK